MSSESPRENLPPIEQRLDEAVERFLTDPLPDEELFIPVHKFVTFTEREGLIRDHPACQRLRGVYQLGQTHLVYIGATHRRFEHAIGTVHVAQAMIDAVNRNCRAKRKPEDLGEKWLVDSQIGPDEVALIRLAALLHDVGHLPAGHTLEDELGLVPPHDGDARLAHIFKRRDWNRNHAHESEAIAKFTATQSGPPGGEESLRELVDRLYQPEAERSGLGITATELVLSLISKDRDTPEQPPDCPIRLQMCRDIVGNTICADLLDYLHRDLHHLGKHKEVDQRLFEYMEVRRDVRTRESAFVIYLRNAENLRSDAVSAILNLLETRYQLFEVALYHRTKLSAAAMLERVISELAAARSTNRNQWLDDLVRRLLDCTDDTALDLLVGEAHKIAKSAEDETRESLRAAARTAQALRWRRLHKTIYQSTSFQLAEHASRVQELYGPSSYDPAGAEGAARSTEEAEELTVKAAEHRLQAVRLLEDDFGLPRLSLVIYCPPRDMSTKVANVRVLVNDEVWRLDKHEASDTDFLTRGHLQAQKHRFKGLWRISVACERSVLAELEEKQLTPTLLRAIQWLVLGVDPDAAPLVVRALAATEGSPWFGREPLEKPEPGQGETELVRYPTGVPALRHYFAE